MASDRKHTPTARQELEDPTLQVVEPNGITPGAAPPERVRKARDETADPQNTIRAHRARIRGTPREDAKSTPRQGPATVSESDPRAVPEHISARYVKVGNEYHFPNGDLAFADRGVRLSTRLENSEVIRDLVTIAKERGWTEIAITGTERFRKEAWQQAKLSGLAVRGYRPSDLERAQLARSDRLRARLRVEYAVDGVFGPFRAIRDSSTHAGRSGARARSPSGSGAGSRSSGPAHRSWSRELSSRRPCGSLLLREDRYP